MTKFTINPDEMAIRMRNSVAERYSHNLEVKELRKFTLQLYAAMAFIIVLTVIFLVIFPVETTAKPVQNQPEYIVKFGYITDFIEDKTEIITEDGCRYYAIDGPEYEENTYVRLMFATKGNANPADDQIIDIIDWK